MNPQNPADNPLIPAVQHLEATLDSDSAGVQRIGDKLVQSLDDSLVSDKNYLQKRVKARMPRLVGNDIRRDLKRINAIAQPMRAAVASSLVADQERVDEIAGRIGELPQSGVAPGGVSCNNLGPVNYLSGELCWETDCPYSGPPPVVVPPQHAVGPLHGHWVICMPWSPGTIPAPTPSPTPQPLPPTPLPAPEPVPAPEPIPEPCPPCPPVPPPPPPVPVPQPAADGCSPLPTDLPGVRVYLVPWLDADAHGLPSIWSQCGEKEIAEAFGALYPAADVVRAIETYGDRWPGPYIGPTAQATPDPSPSEDAASDDSLDATVVALSFAPSGDESIGDLQGVY